MRMRRTMIRMMASTVPTPMYIEPSFSSERVLLSHLQPGASGNHVDAVFGRAVPGNAAEQTQQGGSAVPNKRANVKNEKQYEALKKKGMSKERAARIANSPESSSRGGKKSGSGGSSSQGGTTAQKKAAGRKGGRASAKKN
jgi:hypothetical protein